MPGMRLARRVRRDLSRAVDRALPADLVYLGSQTISNLARGLVYTVLAVYYVTVVGLDPLQLVLVGTILEGHHAAA